MQENNEKITPDLLQRTRLVFYPRTTDEAIFIQQRLFAMGISWAGGLGTAVSKVHECVAHGMVIERGQLYHSPGANAAKRLAKIEQFDGEFLTPEQKFLKEQFDKVHARLDAMDRKIEALQAAVLPQDIGKLPKDLVGKLPKDMNRKLPKQAAGAPGLKGKTP